MNSADESVSDWQPAKVRKTDGRIHGLGLTVEGKSSGDYEGVIIRVRILDDLEGWACSPRFVVQVHPEDAERVFEQPRFLVTCMCEHMILTD